MLLSEQLEQGGLLLGLLLLALDLFLHLNELLELHALLNFLVPSSALLLKTFLLDALALELGKLFVFLFAVKNIVFSFPFTDALAFVQVAYVGSDVLLALPLFIGGVVREVLLNQQGLLADTLGLPLVLSLLVSLPRALSGKPVFQTLFVALLFLALGLPELAFPFGLALVFLILGHRVFNKHVIVGSQNREQVSRRLCRLRLTRFFLLSLLGFFGRIRRLLRRLPFVAAL